MSKIRPVITLCTFLLTYNLKPYPLSYSFTPALTSGQLLGFEILSGVNIFSVCLSFLLPHNYFANDQNRQDLLEMLIIMNIVISCIEPYC